MTFDGLEYISIEHQTTEFPKHFHETFCISLIHLGTEQIDFENQSLFCEAGSISITNPYEIHSNPLIDANAPLKFDTIYIPNEIMKYGCEGKNIIFLNRKISNKNANQSFIKLKKAIESKNDTEIDFCLKQFLTVLQFYAQENKDEYTGLNFSSFNQINTFVESNIHNRFCLNELSELANINKYGFVKKFKASTGMTPMNYILMKKIFSSKKLIDRNAELTEIAYQYNFTDLAHFSKTFKRFIGVSPTKYKEGFLKKLN
ncbi:AraC-like DNA-binding protein [Flavobacterium arsenatis]|uniref:AraC-like DNA-binding protein n=1 Tax=Flavobacterium arsenatis TaxID=1484332 RepID=A0ABU1TT07_9FLAO|nr:AraC family transcriptional regulator [Flavobacterium arsenatis]MDR6968982.1 AraC-like DNA-binding protein [Flavobacterium arsenatis]